MKRILAAGLILALWATAAYAAASYPSAVKSFSRVSTGQIIQATHLNEGYDEIEAIESALLGGFQHVLRPLTGGSYDLGTSSFYWRDLFLSRTLNIAQGSLTADTQALNVTATWNAAATFTALKANITDTLSNAASLLLDLQKGGTSAFTVGKTGAVVATLNNTSAIGLIVKGAASQNGDLSQWQDSTGAVLAAITAGGTYTGVVSATLAAAGTDALITKVTGDTNPRFTLNADGSIEWGPGNAALDILLKRGGATFLQVNAELYSLLASAGTIAHDTAVTGDSTSRFALLADGTLQWGSGAGARDVVLSRAAADVLQLASGDSLRVQQDPSNANDVTRKSYVDALAGPIGMAATLKITRPSVSTVTDTADFAWVENGSGVYRRVATVSDTCNITTSGANGLDTGAEAASTWYFIWVIHRSDTSVTDCLLSASATAPTMPANYDFKARAGAVYNDASSNFVEFVQYGNQVWFPIQQQVGSAVALTGTYASLSLSAAIPTTARAAQVHFSVAAGVNAATLETKSQSSGNPYIGMDTGGASTRFNNGGPFLMLIETAQTIWWRETVDTTNTYNAYVHGYLDSVAAW